MRKAEERVLLVEDHALLLRILRMILEAEGYRVTGVSSGAEALRVMEKALPNLIISDIVMPGMDGYAFYKTIRARPEWGSIPFMFLTARTDEWSSVRAKSLGVDCTITKPFLVENLLAVVRQHLAKAARLAERRALERMMTLKPTEADVDRLLEYAWTGAKAEAPQLDSLRLCSQPIRWDLSLLRSDQLEALDAAAVHRSGSYLRDGPRGVSL